jgi:hypothetical protein
MIEHAVFVIGMTVFRFINITARDQMQSYASSRRRPSPSLPVRSCADPHGPRVTPGLLLERTTRQYLRPSDSKSEAL